MRRKQENLAGALAGGARRRRRSSGRRTWDVVVEVVRGFGGGDAVGRRRAEAEGLDSAAVVRHAEPLGARGRAPGEEGAEEKASGRGRAEHHLPAGSKDERKEKKDRPRPRSVSAALDLRFPRKGPLEVPRLTSSRPPRSRFLSRRPGPQKQFSSRPGTPRLSAFSSSQPERFLSRNLQAWQKAPCFPSLSLSLSPLSLSLSDSEAVSFAQCAESLTTSSYRRSSILGGFGLNVICRFFLYDSSNVRVSRRREKRGVRRPPL